MGNFLRRAIQQAGEFLYNARNAQYAYTNDLKTVASDKLVEVIERREKDAKATLFNLGVALKEGRIGVADWRNAAAFELSRAHSQAYALGRGGWQQMTKEDRAAVSERLKSEYKFMQAFAKDIADGKLSEAQINARINLYAQHIESSYWQGETAAKKAAGFTEEQRVLALVDHCADCPDLAGHWEPIGTLPPPGDGCECGANCKCRMEYR